MGLNKKWQAVVGAVALVAAVGCGGRYQGPAEVDASGRVTVEMRDTMSFTPNRLVKARPGATLTLRIENVGAIPHSFHAPELGLDKPVRVEGGARGTATFTVPTTAGVYQFLCDKPGHALAGMTGRVVVE